MTFRNKPIVVKSVQWDGTCDAYDRICELNTGAQIDIVGDRLIIPTTKGDRFCQKGDMVIRGANGEIYPCKPDEFAQNYEKVEA